LVAFLVFPIWKPLVSILETEHRPGLHFSYAALYISYKGFSFKVTNDKVFLHLGRFTSALRARLVLSPQVVFKPINREDEAISAGVRVQVSGFDQLLDCFPHCGATRIGPGLLTQ